ncbi:fruR/shl operon leader peptide [Salmonella enterica subsp. enterica serovar Newport]|uniref:FruR/shl operon leader peptide n=2 Tax=Salmonella enterica TaxID=28901 RepID=A0A5Z4DZV5_SALER|nr:fruR/shl operon leader peptide [Salmonella enterica]EBF0114560.1 fruR/shl operon leader peptide [Salmonella enterica subsp. enterica]EBS1814873.1 fruR/shl operon leader peptide [Salmonella enterica subsp. enterica serovar Newport]ECA4081716.1 fruR/shl operon leader peptide [Salmonella enterica subsp. enterica serovar Texas]ECA8970333.1 fruR/shl operon leader peptide [Salmonella enterica subsp. enterica serovar Omuna]ECF2427876.1 fruR/shl operon leader peptide [Salmonella enterica subsp. ent
MIAQPNITGWAFFAKSVVTRNKSGCRSDQTALRC